MQEPSSLNQQFSDASDLRPEEKTLRAIECPYEIQPDGTIVVPGDLNLSGLKLTELPDLTDVVVKGSFWCMGNKLKDLTGAPRVVEGDVMCGTNRLTSLEGAPQEVGGAFNCMGNRLTSLKGAPRNPGGAFDCSYNKLTSLEFGPLTAMENYDCSHNQITSLEKGPRFISGDFICNDNKLASLEHGPWRVGAALYCQGNPVTSLEHAPEQIQLLKCDAGEFHSWDEIPDTLAPLRKAQRKRDWDTAFSDGATVLRQPVEVAEPLRLKKSARPGKTP